MEVEKFREFLQSEFSKLKEELRRSDDEKLQRINESLIYEVKNTLFSDLEKILHIYWDIKNCPLPDDVEANQIVGNIKQAIYAETGIEYKYENMAAYGNFTNNNLKEVKDKLINTIGLPLVNAVSKRDNADIAIMDDMFTHTRLHPGSSVLLISGDANFASTLCTLGKTFHHPIFLAIPSHTPVTFGLTSEANKLWCWDNLARGIVTDEESQRCDLSDSVLMLPIQSGDDHYSLMKNELCEDDN